MCATKELNESNPMIVQNENNYFCFFATKLDWRHKSKISYIENGLNGLIPKLLKLGIKSMSIPRLGYKHTNMREGSIFWNYKNGESVLTDDEVKFWLQTAKKEYFFVDDRSIKYQTTNE